MTSITLADALDEAADRLRPHSGSARLDAEVLLAFIVARDRGALLVHGDQRIDAHDHALLRSLVERRMNGEPVAHLVGSREFWSLKFEVGPAVLIPRPDTETLVAAALEVGEACGRLSLVDLGTGSGAIAVAIAHERPGWTVVATDTDTQALEVARRNATRNGVAGIELLQGDWFDAVATRRFDIVVSNPPYVATGDPHLALGDVRFEPRGALVAGPDGLDAIRRIVATAPAHLEDRGWLLLEHGYDQADAVAELLEAGGFGRLRRWRDLGGHVRVTGGIVTACLPKLQRRQGAPTVPLID